MSARAPEPRAPADRVHDIGRSLRRKWPAALAAFVVVGLIAGVLIARATPTYEARAQVLLQPSDAVATLVNPGATSSPANAQREIDTNAALVTITPVADAVRRQLHLRTSTRALLDRVSVSGQDTSNLVWITARDERAGRAARIATAFGEQASLYRQASVRDQVDRAITTGRDTLRGLTDGGARAALRDRLRALRATSALQTGGMTLVHAATVPPRAATPRVKLDIGIAIAVGLIVATLAALLADRRDKRLREPDDFAEAFGHPVLAKVPRSDAGAGAAAADLAAVLAARDLSRGGRVVLFADVASAGRAADVAELVAAHLSAAGHRALLVEATLRREPRLGRPGGGLARLLRHGGPIGPAIERAGLNGAPGPDGPVAYQVLPSGMDGHDAGALLNRRELDAVLHEAGRRADVVIVAGGGVLPKRTSVPLVRDSDAVILVAEPRNTTSEDAARAIEALEPEEDKLIGIVLAEGDRPPLQRARVAEESRVPPSERRREDLVREAAR